MGDELVTPDWAAGILFQVSIEDDDSEYFSVPEKRVPVSSRVEESTDHGLELLIPMWKSRAIALGRDPDSVDKAHVIRRLLRVAVTGALAQALKAVGLKGLPSSKDDWEKLEKALEKLARESR